MSQQCPSNAATPIGSHGNQVPCPTCWQSEDGCKPTYHYVGLGWSASCAESAQNGVPCCFRHRGEAKVVP